MSAAIFVAGVGGIVMAVYDETWNEAMHHWFEPFVAFFFPAAPRDIDWSRGWESLDQELPQVVRVRSQATSDPQSLRTRHDEANDLGTIPADRLDDNTAGRNGTTFPAGTLPVGGGDNDALR